ncbi:MAG: hypothetical protein EGQ35_03750 [Clostridiales bacterium]|nr:hypothetical protein [Clostridiales bacterium]
MNTWKYTKKQRITALFVCIVFVLVTFCSLFYIAKEENHHCTGENCSICISIHKAEQFLKNISNAISTKTLVFTICNFTVNIALLYVLVLPCVSLISQKVRMDN